MCTITKQKVQSPYPFADLLNSDKLRRCVKSDKVIKLHEVMYITISTLSHPFSMICVEDLRLRARTLVTNGEIKRMPNISLISSKSSDENINKYVNIF